MNQAMLLRIKNDCEAFAESLGSVTRPSIPIQQLAKKFGFVINSLSSLAVKTSSGEVIGWWDLIGDFRLLSTPGWINSSCGDQFFGPADRKSDRRVRGNSGGIKRTFSKSCSEHRRLGSLSIGHTSRDFLSTHTTILSIRWSATITDADSCCPSAGRRVVVNLKGFLIRIVVLSESNFKNKNRKKVTERIVRILTEPSKEKSFLE